jgi:regulator of sigma E protease
MSFFLWIMLALLVFFLVVFIHEMGHFLVARWSGVRVHEFGIGIPPRLRRIFQDKHGTEWTLNWLPLGGFVRLKGEDIASPESYEKDALPMATWWKQVAILLAGVTMNFILAAGVFAFLFYHGTEPLTLQIREFAPQALLSRVGQGTQLIPVFDTLDQASAAGVVQQSPGVLLDPISDSPAYRAGIQRGDIALAIDGIPMTRPEDFSQSISTIGTHVVRISRAGVERDISIMPIDGKIGTYVTPNIHLIRYQYGFFDAIGHGIYEVWQQIGFSFRTFGSIISTSFSDTATHEQKQEATAGIGWPVAIGRVFVDIADNGIDLRAVIVMMAMISLSLWVFNLLPFPALDGGRVFVILVNQMIHVVNPRFRISPKIEQMVHSAGFMLLILASILVTWKDIFLN